jgi:hypothetical protein
MEGCFERQTLEIRCNGFHQVGREVVDGELVKEAFDPYDVEGLSHIQEYGPVSIL